jgi:predicted DsbA family dithiol-disulfide isomerase
MIEVSVWSDIHCPWATVAVHRLRAARDRDQLDVVFDQRAWPLEFVNAQGTPKLVVQETAVLAQHEPDLFSAYRNESWPSTFLPAFELVAAARRVGGLRVAEDVDYAMRLAFFRKSIDVSIRAGLEKALAVAAGLNPELDAPAVLAAWDSGAARADVLADYERSKSLPIQGSPQVFWPDGTTTHNPGMGDHTWVRGIPRIHTADPDAPGRLLREKIGGQPHVD